MIHKISSTIVLEMEYRLFGCTPMVHGTITISMGRGHKRDIIKFIWNMGIDTYPKLIDRKYDKNEVEQLSHMIQFYTTRMEPDIL